MSFDPSAKFVPEESALSRRTHVRLFVKINVEYKLIKSGDKFARFDSEQLEIDDSSTTRDISAGGVSFFSDVQVPVGSVLEMRIELPDGNKEAVDCLARVERVEEVKKGKIYVIGIYFLDITREDRLRIDDFVTSKSVPGSAV